MKVAIVYECYLCFTESDFCWSSLFRETQEKPGWCEDPLKPPCAGYDNSLFLCALGLVMSYVCVYSLCIVGSSWLERI
jgi:hypothetical protein